MNRLGSTVVKYSLNVRGVAGSTLQVKRQGLVNKLCLDNSTRDVGILIRGPFRGIVSLKKNIHSLLNVCHDVVVTL